MQYQTPIEVIEYMSDMIPGHVKHVMEPTPGHGRMVNVLKKRGYDVFAPGNFFEVDEKSRFDAIIMNPPFSDRSAFGVPVELSNSGMKLGYFILRRCMEMSNNVIAIMPWFVLIDSDLRHKYIRSYGLKSITGLPRKTFNYLRIQTCVLELEKGWTQDPIFKIFHFADAQHKIEL